VATLARALIREFPQYYSLFSLREFTWNNIRQQNRNGLLDKDPSVDGLKTGHTDSAGYCLATSAKRGSTRVIAVVLGSNSIRGREDASAALLTYGFTFFETVNLKKRGEAVLKPRVYKGGEEFIAVGPMTDINVTVPRGQGAAIQTSATVRRPLLAPLDPNLAVGTLQVTLDGKTLANVPLYPLGAVARGGFWSRLSDTILLWFQK
jgi:D-alanyl-D-alanine carboxypeptidase (penicillin-binding protein 5/6)